MIYPVVGSCSLRTLPRREEARKVLDSLAIAASPYILFDNIRGKIASEDVEAFITSAEVYGRVLGESSDFRVDNVATVFLTGNQASTSGDMAERCLFVELFIEEVDNRARHISRIIDDDFLSDPARRSELLSAMWSLVRAWEADGKPTSPSPLMPRFETWSKLVPAIVYASGLGDPLEVPLVQRDAELRDMHELIKLLAPEEEKDTRHWTFGEIIEQIQGHELFEDSEIWQGRQPRTRPVSKSVFFQNPMTTKQVPLAAVGPGCVGIFFCPELSCCLTCATGTAGGPADLYPRCIAQNCVFLQQNVRRP